MTDIIPKHLNDKVDEKLNGYEYFDTGNRDEDQRYAFESGASFGYQLAVDEIKRLEDCLKRANSNHEEFERKWYLEKDKADEQKKMLDEVEKALEFYADGESWSTIDHNKSPTTYDRLEYDKDLGVGDFDINEQTNDRNVSGLRARLALEKLKAHRGTNE